MQEMSSQSDRFGALSQDEWANNAMLIHSKPKRLNGVIKSNSGTSIKY